MLCCLLGLNLMRQSGDVIPGLLNGVIVLIRCEYNSQKIDSLFFRLFHISLHSGSLFQEQIYTSINSLELKKTTKLITQTPQLP